MMSVSCIPRSTPCGNRAVSPRSWRSCVCRILSRYRSVRVTLSGVPCRVRVSLRRPDPWWRLAIADRDPIYAVADARPVRSTRKIKNSKNTVLLQIEQGAHSHLSVRACRARHVTRIGSAAVDPAHSLHVGHDYRSEVKDLPRPGVAGPDQPRASTSCRASNPRAKPAPNPRQGTTAMPRSAMALLGYSACGAPQRAVLLRGTCRRLLVVVVRVLPRKYRLQLFRLLGSAAARRLPWRRLAVERATGDTYEQPDARLGPNVGGEEHERRKYGKDLVHHADDREGGRGDRRAKAEACEGDAETNHARQADRELAALRDEQRDRRLTELLRLLARIQYGR